MTRTQLKTFLTELIKLFPDSRAQITNKGALLDDWFYAFERVDHQKMIDALDVFRIRGKYFPSPDEFSIYLKIVDKEQSRTTRVFEFMNSGCSVCPYFEEGQKEPCDNCMFE